MSDPARVLICSFDVLPAPTGGSRRLSQYVQALSGRFQIVGLCSKGPDTPHIEKFHGARLLRVPGGEGDLASRVSAYERAVRRQVESEEYDLVHFTDPFSGYALCERKAHHSHALLYDAQTFPSYELATQGADRKFLAMARRQELFCLANADQILTGSNVTRHHVQALGVAPEKLRVLRAPVDLTSIVPGPPPLAHGGPLRLLYLGSQALYQGLETLLRGVQLATREVPLRLTVIGPREPERQARLEELVVELQLDAVVELKPPVSHAELAEWLRRADVGVAPLEPVERNQMQGGPLAKVSEYLAAGRPVLAADLPLTRELVPSEAGLFFRAGDVKHLSERLIAWATNPAQLAEKSARARAYAEERLAATTLSSKLADTWERLVRSARKTGGSRPARVDPPAPSAVATFDDEVTQRVVVGPSPSPPEPPLPSEVRPPPLPLPAAPPSRDEAGFDVEEPTAPGDDPRPRAGLDPWLALLVHGWCPPEGANFERHPPPTNFPGREPPKTGQGS